MTKSLYQLFKKKNLFKSQFLSPCNAISLFSWVCGNIRSSFYFIALCCPYLSVKIYDYTCNFAQTLTSVIGKCYVLQIPPFISKMDIGFCWTWCLSAPVCTSPDKICRQFTFVSANAGSCTDITVSCINLHSSQR